MVLEILRVDDSWFYEPLADFFENLGYAGEVDVLSPYHLTAEEAYKRTIGYKGGKNLYYVLVEGKRVIGYGFLRGWDKGYNIPSLGIVIHPAERGKGLGRLLMLFLHAVARRRGAEKVMIKVKPDNEAALHLYRSLGYRFPDKVMGRLVGFCDLN